MSNDTACHFPLTLATRLIEYEYANADMPVVSLQAARQYHMTRKPIPSAFPRADDRLSLASLELSTQKYFSLCYITESYLIAASVTAAAGYLID